MYYGHSPADKEGHPMGTIDSSAAISYNLMILGAGIAAFYLIRINR